MPSHPVINVLLVDRSLSDVEAITRALRGAGFVVHASRAEVVQEVEAQLAERPPDVVLVRQGTDLPGVDAVRAMVDSHGGSAAIIAVVDAEHRPSRKELLQLGADNSCDAEDLEQVALVVRKEYSHLREHREAEQARQALSECEGRWRALMDSCRDPVAYVHEGAYVYANAAYLTIFGLADEQELEGLTVMEAVSRADRDVLRSFLRRAGEPDAAPESVALTCVRADGEEVSLTMSSQPVIIDHEPCLQLVMRAPASTPPEGGAGTVQQDGLTMLPNRVFFRKHLEQVCAQAQSGRDNGAVLYILLTQYRSINERLGLEAGDQILMDIGAVLQQSIAGDDVAARFSDSVFTVYTPRSTGAAATGLAERLRKAIEENVSHAANTMVTTTCCIGVAPVSADPAMEILARADQACETARQMGGSQVQTYKQPVSANLESGHDEGPTSLLQSALAQDQIGLLYQPIASFQGDAVERYKVTLDVRDPEGNALPLDKMAPAAERRGAMKNVDRWTLEHCMQVLGSGDASGAKRQLFVRVSRNSLSDEGFAAWLGSQLAESGVDGQCLVVEAAEDAAEQYFKETKALREALRKLGCGFALSHFGGKANSARMLRQLGPNYIKLDSALIEKLAKEPSSRQAMAALAEQARTMETWIIAADVASAPQMASIWQFGVGLVQGDVVQPPAPEMAFDFAQFAG